MAAAVAQHELQCLHFIQPRQPLPEDKKQCRFSRAE
jgi:hypothetical protein